MRPREAVLKRANELIRIIPEKNGGDAFLAGGDQNGTQVSLANREPDLLVHPAGTVLGWGHTEHIGGLLVKTSARIEARIVDRFGDAATRRQSVPDFRCAPRGGV